VPELPDVERFRRVLVEHAVGARIVEVVVHDAGVVRNETAPQFVRNLKGKVFGEPQRRGKWLLAPTNGPTILFHFGMTGSLDAAKTGDPPQRFDRLTFITDRGQLAFRDQRKLKGIWLARSKSDVEELIGPQGPDALGLSEDQLSDCLKTSRRPLKSVLMDQTVIAGLGNMLSDEILWRSHLHPTCRFVNLEQRQQQRLARSLQRVLVSSIKAGRIPRSRSWLNSQRTESDPHCPRCGHRLQTSKIGGRTSYWCPTCQPHAAS
jgi:formamidopyrimidine-DNA glycosylase